jgi:tetratricopeptide (TPR) repeat protein
MISATSAEAPKKARNAYEKGQNAIRKGDWQAAANNFGKAVREFPRYATAWQELGLVQLKLNQKDAAQESFHAAVEADPKLLPSYAELAEMALEQKRWQDVVDETDHLLQLDPVNYPQFWFLNSAANYNLQKIDQAERSVLRGLAIDKIQRFPKMQYLLGVILALKHDYRGAALHIRQYLSLVPHAPDAQIAERQLQQCEKLSGAGN